MSAAHSIHNIFLDKEFVNAIVKGAATTLSTVAQTEVICGKPFVDKKFHLRGDVAGMVGMIAPPMKGTLVISFTKSAILFIVENMIGEKYAEITPEVTDAVGELTNMIYGSAKTTLNKLGHNFEMAIPTVVRGEFTIINSQTTARLIVPFSLPNKSEFFVELTVG